MSSTSDRAAASVQSARGRHRRPSGEPPPLPRPTWWRASVITLAATIVFGVVVAVLYDDDAGQLLVQLIDGLRLRP